MKAVKFNLSVLGFISILIISCSSGGVEKADSHSADMSNDIIYDYNKILKDQKVLSVNFSWPLKHELDLNGDGVSEAFLAVEGYSRGMGYALFYKENNKWSLISGGELVPSGHLGIKIMKNRNKGWSDFTALQPSGRGGMIESCYSWDGKKYVQKKQVEVDN